MSTTDSTTADTARSAAAGDSSASVAALPAVGAWAAAARRHEELFAPLDPGARVALLSRASPQRVLVWEAGDGRIEARLEPFGGYSSSAADIVLSADEESLAELCLATGGAAGDRLFEVLRAGIRSGHIVCYMLKRRCVLEERGFDELLDALGFAFMGACR